VIATIGGANGSALALDHGFLGVNLRADATLTASSASVLNSTGIQFIRWPGGGDGDRFDPTAHDGQGVIYNDNGQTSTPGTTLAEFVAWCRSASCASVITLPAEIDNTSMETAIVNYTEVSLDFRPTYWEIGNEPTQWTHFGIPWAKWNSSQNSAPTPAQYAALVQSYVRALRLVDNITGIVGIGGIGKGSVGVSTWFAPTLQLSGLDLSAMAIHVYPAGLGFPSSDLADWFGSLWGSTGLPYRVDIAQAEMQSACASCHLALLVDELQTGTGLISSTSLSGGYLATYIAAEIVQALPLPVLTLDYYVFQASTPGAWFNTSGVSSASYTLYQGLATELGPEAVQLNVTSSSQGLLAAEGGVTSLSMTNLLLVNANATTGFRLNLSTRFPDASAGTAWVFNGSSGNPSTFPIGASGAVNWTLPPASLVILHGIGLPNPATVGRHTTRPRDSGPRDGVLPVVPNLLASTTTAATGGRGMRELRGMVDPFIPRPRGPPAAIALARGQTYSRRASGPRRPNASNRKFCLMMLPMGKNGIQRRTSFRFIFTRK
jgi:hypothetical protein